MIILSLTTTADRIGIARYTLLSLLEQSTEPDKIQLSLSSHPHLNDDGIEETPEWLTSFQRQNPNLTVHYTKNTGPYRKLIPALSESTEDDLVITCDDDVIYGPDWLESLLQCAESYPSHIVCGRARRPVKNILGRTQSYLHWPALRSPQVAHDLIPIGVSGVVYRPYLLDTQFAADESFLQVAPRQDDLWFKEASRRANTPVVIAEEADNHVHEIKTKTALSRDNASASYSSEWGTASVLPFLERAIFRFKAYLGLCTCDNDHAWQAIQEYSAKH